MFIHPNATADAYLIPGMYVRFNICVRVIFRTGQKKMRWAMCTDDIYNSSPLLTSILDAGKTLPIKRSRGMEQPLFKVSVLE